MTTYKTNQSPQGGNLTEQQEAEADKHIVTCKNCVHHIDGVIPCKVLWGIYYEQVLTDEAGEKPIQ